MSATTNSKGKYSLTDLSPGSYVLEVYSLNSEYPPVFSGEADSFDTATPVVVQEGMAVPANMAFPHYTGSVTGQAFWDYYGEFDIPLSLATPIAYPVTAEDSNGDATAADTDREVVGARVNSAGNWSIRGLAPGDYVVEMFPWYYNEPAEYVAPSGGTPDLSDATVFHVGTVATPPSFSEFYVENEGGSVAVTVTDAANDPWLHRR